MTNPCWGSLFFSATSHGGPARPDHQQEGLGRPHHRTPSHPSSSSGRKIRLGKEQTLSVCPKRSRNTLRNPQAPFKPQEVVVPVPTDQRHLWVTRRYKENLRKSQMVSARTTPKWYLLERRPQVDLRSKSLETLARISRQTQAGSMI